MVGLKRFDELLDLIYEAGLNPAEWPKFLSALNEEFAGGGGFLFSQHVRRNQAIAEHCGVDPSWMDAYYTHYAATNLWVKEAADWPAGSFLISHEMVDQRTFEASEWYNDWLRPQNLYHGFGFIVQREPDVITMLSVLRPRPAGEYGADELKLIDRLGPHVRRALQIHQKLGEQRLQAEGWAFGLDQVHIGVMIVAEDGRLLAANRSAEQELRKARALSVRNNRLHSRTPQDTDALLSRIREAAKTTTQHGESAGGLWTTSLPEGDTFSVLVCPLRARRRAVEFQIDEGALLLFSDPDHCVGLREPAIRKLYRLTLAEAHLVNALINGERLADYADRTHVSLNTVKTHLKNVFGKMGVTRQAELIRLVLANATVHEPSA